MNRSIILTAGLLVSATLQAAPQTWVTDLKVQGTSIGKNTFTLRDDGTFVSESEIAAGPVTVREQAQGVWRDQVLSNVSLTTTSGGRTVEFRLDGTVLLNRSGTGEWGRKELGVKPDALFANFHPQLSRGITDRASGEVNLLLMDSGAMVKSKLTPKAGRVVKVDGQSVLARPTQFSLSGIQIEVAADARDGWILGVDVPTQKAQFIRKGVVDLFVDPLSRYPELSQPTMDTAMVPKEMAKMRDGVELAATIVRPKPEGRYPVILLRTPYGRTAEASNWGAFYAKRGYVVVSQDVRGMGESGGEWDPFLHERLDGADTINWIAAQPWCDGNVGMIGASYGGLVQWQAAVERPVALKCVVPQVSPPDPFYNIPFDHGAFFLAPNAWWARIVAGRTPDFSQMDMSTTGFEKFTKLPLSEIDTAVLGQDIPFWNRWLTRDTPAKWAGANYLADLKKVTIPALLISGWYDGDLPGTTMAWEELRRANRTNQWLIMGPWSHAFNTTSAIADLEFGPESLLELESVYLRFFDTFLKGKDVKFSDRSRAQIFLTGANEWRGMPDYPHRLSRERTLFLSAPLPANNAVSGGKLLEAPTPNQEPSRIFYNPFEVGERVKQSENQTPTFKFSFDQLHGDELFFKTDPVFQPLDLCGPIELDLHFTSTAKDCDFYATLVDIDKSGTLRAVGQGGKIRASYAKNMNRREPLVPGKMARAKIKLWDVAHQFKTGHRLGIVISCNLFPTFDRNLGLAEPPATATQMVTSLQTIYHDEKRPSKLTFRVLPPLE